MCALCIRSSNQFFTSSIELIEKISKHLNIQVRNLTFYKAIKFNIKIYFSTFTDFTKFTDLWAMYRKC